jgi:hypothetical protein
VNDIWPLCLALGPDGEPTILTAATCNSDGDRGLVATNAEIVFFARPFFLSLTSTTAVQSVG